MAKTINGATPGSLITSLTVPTAGDGMVAEDIETLAQIILNNQMFLDADLKKALSQGHASFSVAATALTTTYTHIGTLLISVTAWKLRQKFLPRLSIATLGSLSGITFGYYYQSLSTLETENGFTGSPSTTGSYGVDLAAKDFGSNQSQVALLIQAKGTSGNITLPALTCSLDLKGQP